MDRVAVFSNSLRDFVSHLALRVTYQNIIVRIENEERDLLLDTERLAGAGNAQPEGRLIEQVRLVAHDKVVGVSASDKM